MANDIDLANPGNTYPKKKKKRNRKRKSKGKKKDGQNQMNDNLENKDPKAGGLLSNQNQEKIKKKRKRNRKNRVPNDRYFGRFCCRLCNRHWDSALVFTIGGTKKVMYRQRCKNCKEGWMFPFHLQLLQCRQCMSTPCECLCEECDKLKHPRFVTTEIPEDGDVQAKKTLMRTLDENHEYCDCEKAKKRVIGDKNDMKKPHMSEFCEKCQKGYPCQRGTQESDNESSCNEP